MSDHDAEKPEAVKREPREQPRIDDDLPTDEWLDEYGKWETELRNKPITKASEKLYHFVNECVRDPDFQQSPGLLELLLVIRDVLADGATEDWGLDDYLGPVVSMAASYANRVKAEKLEHIKREIIAEWLLRLERGDQLDRVRFSDEMAEKYSEMPEKYKRVAASTIRKDYLSKNAIDEYLLALRT